MAAGVTSQELSFQDVIKFLEEDNKKRQDVIELIKKHFKKDERVSNATIRQQSDKNLLSEEQIQSLCGLLMKIPSIKGLKDAVDAVESRSADKTKDKQGTHGQTLDVTNSVAQKNVQKSPQLSPKAAKKLAPSPSPVVTSPQSTSEDSKTEDIKKLQGENNQLKTENEKLKKEKKKHDKLLEAFQQQEKTIEKLEDDIRNSKERERIADDSIKKLEDHLRNKAAEQKKEKAEFEERMTTTKDSYDKTMRNLQKENHKLQMEVQAQIERYNTEQAKALSYKNDFEVLKKHFNELKQKHVHELQTLNDEKKAVLKERDDIRDRFSKLAGDKLTQDNADIADLSDPNRAMKLSEKFGQLYDDEWTDAFSELINSKIQREQAILFLLDTLKKCWEHCKSFADGMLISLQSALLHGNQNPANVASSKDLPKPPKADPKLETLLKAVRRQYGSNISGQVKQNFLAKISTTFDGKMIEMSKPYIEACSGICWLMMLHDPPLYIDLSLKEGDKFDANVYTGYSQSGKVVQYLVWPPLYNKQGGGLLSKGTAELKKTISKK